MTKRQKERLATLRERFRTQSCRSVESMMERTELQSLCHLEIKEDRKRFGKNYDWMIELLFRHDPIQLACMGMPSNEYESEARMILKAIDGHEGTPTLEQILQITYDTFKSQFSGDSVAGNINDPTYQLASSEIYNNLIRFGK